MKVEAEIGDMKPQGSPGATGSWKRQEGFSPRGSGGGYPAHLGLLASGTPENTFLLFSATKFVVICSRNPKKLIQYLAWDTGMEKLY